MKHTIQYWQIVKDGKDLAAIQWPDGSGVFAAKHPVYRVVNYEHRTYVYFSDDMSISVDKWKEFTNRLELGLLTCVLVDLVNASNPISLRKPSMNARRKQ